MLSLFTLVVADRYVAAPEITHKCATLDRLPQRFGHTRSSPVTITDVDIPVRHQGPNSNKAEGYDRSTHWR